MKVIKYLPKVTAAKTTYCEIDPKDMAWLQMELIRYLAVCGEQSINRDTDVRAILRSWWVKRVPSLPKGRTGQNSPLSFVAGLLNNIAFGTQRDLSNIQMNAIENISAVMVQFLEAIHQIDASNITRNNDSVIFQIGIGV
jgi:hypothetical protein